MKNLATWENHKGRRHGVCPLGSTKSSIEACGQGRSNGGQHKELSGGTTLFSARGGLRGKVLSFRRCINTEGLLIDRIQQTISWIYYPRPPYCYNSRFCLLRAWLPAQAVLVCYAFSAIKITHLHMCIAS